MLEARLLGQFDVRVDGVRIPIASRPSESLFAYLVLHAGRLHRREKLAGLLWPVSSDDNARNNLRQALWRARKAFRGAIAAEHEIFVADNFAIGLNSEIDFQLDVSTIEASLPANWRLEDLEQALAQYGGELLPGFYEEWVLIRRAYVQGIYHQKMQLLLDRLTFEGRWSESIRWAEQWIRYGGQPEPAYRALMLAYHGQGDTSGVVSVYQRCMQALGEGLGVTPSGETMGLYQSLIADEAESVWTPERRPSSIAEEADALEDSTPLHQGRVGQIESQPFVARSEELARMQGYLEQAIAGRGQVAFITGEAGSGKTALASEFVRRALDRYTELVVAFGRCNDITGIGDPFLPFREVLASLLGGFEMRAEDGHMPPELASRLSDFFPQALESLTDNGLELVQRLVSGRELMARAKSHPAVSHDLVSHLQVELEEHAARRGLRDLRQEDLYQQVTQVLLNISKVKPLVIVLDDLQWADMGSIGLLFHLGRRLSSERILLICAHRSEVQPREHEGEVSLRGITAEFKKIYGDIQIELGTLDARERERFIGSFLDTESNQFDSQFRHELLRHTNGNPLFTIELLRAMQARGDIYRDEHSAWVQGRNLQWDALPARIEGALEERLSRLDETSVDVLNVASVEGWEFTAEVIGRVLNVSVREVVGRLSKVLDQEYHLVAARRTRRIGPQRISQYRFRHILFQKHLYKRMDAVQRAYLHEDVAKRLEELYGEEGDEIALQLAHHFSEAGMAKEAIHYLLIAGNQAERLSAYDEAILHFSKAISMLDRILPASERAGLELELQTALGVALVSQKGYAAREVEQTFLRAREICAQMGKRPAMFPILYGLRTFHLVRGEYAAAHELGEQLLSIGRAEEDTDMLLEAHQAVGTTLFYLGQLEQARDHLRSGLALYEIKRHHMHAWQYGQDPSVVCHSYLALTLWCFGCAVQARVISDLALDIAEQVAHPISMALALVFAAVHAWMYREIDRVAELSEKAISLCDKNDFTFWGAAANILRGLAALEKDCEGAADQINQGLEIYQGTGASLGLPHFLSMLAETLVGMGEFDTARRTLEDAFRASEKAGDRLIIPELFRIQGELHMASGRSGERMCRCFEQAISAAQAQKNLAFELRARLSQCRSRAGKRDQEPLLQALGETINSFEEGHETADLLAAIDLLESS